MFLLSSVLLLSVVLTLCKCDFYVSVDHVPYLLSPWSKKRIVGVTSGGGHGDVGDNIHGAKLHLVDLTDSKRAKKKDGADGIRLREGRLMLNIFCI